MWSGARRLTEHDQEKKDEKRKKIRWARVTRAVARRRTMGDAIPRGINSVFLIRNPRTESNVVFLLHSVLSCCSIPLYS
jgi:hypothetical protein